MGGLFHIKYYKNTKNMSHNIVSLPSQRNKIFSTQISQELLTLPNLLQPCLTHSRVWSLL